MRYARRILIAGAALVVPALTLANGFALFEHGARGVGMAGAFGAIANDPSAGYYNPAGLAFLDGFQTTAGFFLITQTSEFTGANPFPGSSYRVEMEDQIFYPPHIHLKGGITDNLHWGFSITAPYGLGTWWPDDYAGRFITKRVDLKVFNLNPNIAYRISDHLAVAVGFDYYLSKVDLTRGIGAINPFTQQATEIAQVHMYNDDWATGTGYNAGLLGKLGSFSFGASYRSKVEIEYDDAKASFVQFPTGHPDFDAIVATMLPFSTNPRGQTRVEYPDEMRLALGWQRGALTIGLDVVQMGWDSFDELPIILPDYPQLSSVRPENYEDAWTYRLGFEYRTSPRFAFQLGYLRDETPVPVESVSPLLPDADRDGYSAGLSWNLTPRTRLDISYLYLPFETRSTEGRDLDNYNGTYDTTAHLLGLSLSMSF